MVEDRIVKKNDGQIKDVATAVERLYGEEKKSLVPLR
jgi:hypothetical protein